MTTTALKTRFKRAYDKCSNETSNPITLIIKVTVLIGMVSIMYPYQLIKKVLTEKEYNVIEKLYSVLADKIIRCLHLDKDTVRINLTTTFRDNNKIISKEHNLFHINGMNNNKIVYISKEYNFRVHKTMVTFRLRVAMDLCKTFFNYYVKERDSLDMTVYCPGIKKILFTGCFIILNLPVILFI